jgi:hypothetical protein
MRSLRLALPLIALLASAVFASSAGAAGWVTGEALSPSNREALDPILGITPSGERIAAWRQRTPGAVGATDDGIAVRIAPPGGAFGDPQILGDRDASTPTLATGPDDNVALVWLSDGKLHVARLAPGATSFTEATPFTPPAGARSPVRVALQGGDVYLAFQSEEFAANDVFVTSIHAARLAAGASTVEVIKGAGPGGALDAAAFREGQNPEPEHEVDDPSIAVGGGSVHVAWEDLRDSNTRGVDSITTVRRASRSISGGDFSAPIGVDIIPDGFRAEPVGPRVVAAGSDVRVAWSRGGNAVAAQSVTPGAPIQTVATSGFAFNLHPALDRSGTLVLAWDQVVPNQLAFSVFGAKLAASDATGTAGRLTPATANSTLDALAAGADGSVLAVPDRRNDNIRNTAIERVQGSFAAPGNPLGDLEEISGSRERVGDGAFDSAVAALGADGTALVGWTADDGSGSAVNRYFLSERDATAPSIKNVSVPARASAGAQAAFAAEAADALSPVTLSWDFGDGSHGRGGLVSHVYGAPGTYTATVTARDGAGNVASERHTVLVAPAGNGPDHTAPMVTRLRSEHARFRVGTRTTATIAAARKRAPAGTTFRLTVSERSTLVVSFKRRAGRRRITVPGVLVRTRRGPGSVAIPFSGRVGGARLKPGSYSASVTAIDAAGNRSRPATVSFKVVSR